MTTRTIPKPIRATAVKLLEDFVPDLTEDGLVKALRHCRQTPADGDLLPPATPVAGKLLTVRQTAERLQCSTRAVWRLIETNRLPKRMLGRRSARIPEEAVLRLSRGEA